jgi:hypothetical protein
MEAAQPFGVAEAYESLAGAAAVTERLNWSVGVGIENPDPKRKTAGTQ